MIKLPKAGLLVKVDFSCGSAHFPSCLKRTNRAAVQSYKVADGLALTYNRFRSLAILTKDDPVQP